MSTLATMPYVYPMLHTVERHTLPLPAMCPVSGNPRPGSTIAITYVPRRAVLEVFSLERYIKSFIGGKRLADGRIVRDMEQTICEIAQACAAALHTPVLVEAHLVLQHDHQLHLQVFAPGDEIAAPVAVDTPIAPPQ